MMKSFISLLVAALLMISFASCGETQSDESSLFEPSGTADMESSEITNAETGNEDSSYYDGDSGELSVKLVEIRENYIDVEPVSVSYREEYGRIRLNIEFPNELLPKGIRPECLLNIRYHGKITPATKEAPATIEDISGIEYSDDPFEDKNGASFFGRVTETGKGKICVLPLEGEHEARYDYAFPVYVNDEAEFEAGDLVCVTYSYGIILETHPPQLGGTSSVEVIDESRLAGAEVFHNGEIVRPFHNSIGSHKWQNGWIFSDGILWREVLTRYSSEVPTVYSVGDEVIYLSERYRENSNNSASMIILKAGTKLDGSEEISEFDDVSSTRLNDLDAGVYYIVLQLSWRGDFIDEAAEFPREYFETDEEYHAANPKAYERGGENYIFRYVVS